MTKHDSEYQQLVESIKRGALYLGGELFTVNDIANHHKVHVGQANKAIRAMMDEGYVYCYENVLPSNTSLYVRRQRLTLLQKPLASYQPSILESELTASLRFIYKGGLNCGYTA